MPRSSDRRAAALAFLAMTTFVSGPAFAATVTGDVAAPSVVWISGGPPPAPVTAEMRNVAKSFVPELVVVPMGSTIRFPNDDPFFHSIYSDSNADPFDVGYYSTGPGKAFDFPTPGVVAVACHIHARMHATIIVVDGPWQNPVDAHYELRDVPAGTHVLHVWDQAHGERTRNITIPSRTSAVVRVSGEL